VTNVSAGYHSTCAVVAGGAKCWGDDVESQAGDDTRFFSRTPIPVAGLAAPAALIVGGEYHTCSLSSAGAVSCWGLDDSGQLGDGSLIKTPHPVGVTGLGAGVVALAAGGVHNCAVTSIGAVQCWGSNSQGQLGNGTKVDSSIPVDVTGLGSGFVAVSASGGHSCALSSAGAVKCWGSGTAGQLGNGISMSSLVPVAVTGLGSGVASISSPSTGASTCVVTAAGAVKCWGDNYFGELGNNSTTNSAVPVDVVGLGSGVATVVAGVRNACVITTAGALQCWGVWSPVPIAVAGFGSGVVGVASGQFHTCAVSASGAVACWGQNSLGELGDNTTTPSNSPVGAIGAGSGVVALGAGGYHTCAITSTGAVQCWGSNNTGQIGYKSSAQILTPIDVTGLGSGVVAVAAGTDFACALTSTGAVECWGHDGHGKLGDGSLFDSPVPVGVSGLGAGNTAISTGADHACAITAGGGLKCWGLNYDGQLGNGTYADSAVPVGVSGLSSGVVAVSAGKMHTCAITSAGAVKCWGNNGYGELGSNVMGDSPLPGDVTGLGSGATAIAASEEHTCAVVAGAARCWGTGSNGQLGNNSTASSNSPVAVVGLGASVVAVATGAYHSCALTSAGAVECWGFGGYLGNNSLATSLVPVGVSGLGSGVVALSAKDRHACAITSAGTLLCWGNGTFGELGVSNSNGTLVPLEVTGL
jgi:alpha-tubulin suppressor-like RCC1 family protein